MDEKEARSVFGLETNFSRTGLKKFYRERARVAHPDVGGSEEGFQRLQAAYNLLWSLATDDEHGVSKATETVDGTPLSELGKGYPISVAARTCDGCDGKGYRELHEPSGFVSVPCPTCKGHRVFSYPCTACGGSGRFRSPRDGKDIGECDRCRGTGLFFPKAKPEHCDWLSRATGKVIRHPRIEGEMAYPCKACHGYGTTEVPAGDRIYTLKCSECGGVGEIKMWNPVLPRGFLAAQGSK